MSASNGLETQAYVDIYSAQLTALEEDAASDATNAAAFKGTFEARLNADQSSISGTITGDYASLRASFKSQLQVLADSSNAAVIAFQAALQTHLNKDLGQAHGPLCIMNQIYVNSVGDTVAYQVILFSTLDGTARSCLYVPASLGPNYPVNPATGGGTNPTGPSSCVCGTNYT